MRIVKEFDYRKQGFSDYKGMELPELPSIDSVDMTIAQVLALIDEKCKNISVPKDPSALLTLEQLLGEISHTVVALNETIASFNAATRRASNRKTILRKELCTEMAKKVRRELDEQIQERNSTFDQYKSLNDEIQKEEALSKRDKRGAVAELFSKLLRIMFGEKYVFDKELFSIQFKQSSLDTDAERVMSDGEKTIVAFCFFIASTYELLSYDDDAQRLFFVIDDPISSLDYHFVYSVAQSIKSLGGYFGIESSNLRLLVMTHNSAFFNMLCRNNIVNGRFLMRNGTIEKADKSGVVHYFDHLKDINDALHDGDISHTIGYLQYLSYQLLAALIRNSAGHAAYCKRNPADNSLDGIMSSSDGGLWNGGSSIKTTSCSICMNTMENLTTPLLLGGFRCREAACQRTQSVRLETLQCYVMITMRAMAISRASSAPLAMLWASSATTEATGDGWSPMKGRPGANRSWRSRGCAASRASRSTPSSQGSSPPAPQTPQASARKSRAITPSAR